MAVEEHLAEDPRAAVRPPPEAVHEARLPRVRVAHERHHLARLNPPRDVRERSHLGVYYGLLSQVYTLRHDFVCFLIYLVLISAPNTTKWAEIDTKSVNKQSKSCRKVYTRRRNP